MSYMFFDSMNKFVAPIIVVFISRTCYSTICLDRSQADRASSLKVNGSQFHHILIFSLQFCKYWLLYALLLDCYGLFLLSQKSRTSQ